MTADITWVAQSGGAQEHNRRGDGVGYRRGKDGRRLWVAYDMSTVVHRVTAREAHRLAVDISLERYHDTGSPPWRQ
jgi:hypothetical protein